ncbi:hypothetical protein [Winogradskyella immobilis]|uniref:TfoX N-terminal domain-containing protein n=1 Tax=Winogradskyella immobilis TaxID=2816852 RepID=A0ABS8EQM9_9FLAO|nr:hypothetical protein [Winogradskyella immobilis]MCC1485152.1 hypothetical protein [Winogradskyella immobilis]MCG0017244.1 hypothetical protein [Winogradskyella immobilis]
MSKWNDTLKLYDKLVDQCPDFKRKGKSMIYTSANGYMFSLLNKAGEIGFRLPKPVAAKFMEDYNTGYYYSYGAKMKDYVLVPESLYTNEALLIDFLNQSYAFVMSLPPK